MRFLRIVGMSILLASQGLAFADDKPLTPEQESRIAWAKNLWQSLNRQHGKIVLPNGVATLNIGEKFYYLNPDDAEKVLVQVWKNPPGKKSLGMIIPEGSTPFDQDAWAVTIRYEEDGYVSDADADKINYYDLLKEMQDSAKEESQARVKQGYEAIELVGWAAKPYYDKPSHKLYWAKEFKIAHNDVNSLNYNIRVLGRKGVLVLNFISGIDQLKTIESRLPDVLAAAEFNSGYKYDEFDPSLDKVAAYGLGALVAGKLIAKTGAIAAILIALKKFWIILAVGIAALFKKLFGRNKTEV